MLENYVSWTGNIDDLREVATALSTQHQIDDIDDTYSVRLVRDYIQRGLLGNIERSGKELRFEYEQLLRFIVVRIMLADGWMLGKIQEHLSLSTIEEIEGFLPSQSKEALDLVKRLRTSVSPKFEQLSNADQVDEHLSLSYETMSESRASRPRFGIGSIMKRKIQEKSSIQREMKDALRRLDLPEDGPATEDFKLFALAPFCQVLITEERFQRLTVHEARELGEALTASLTAKILNKGGKR